MSHVTKLNVCCSLMKPINKIALSRNELHCLALDLGGRFVSSNDSPSIFDRVYEMNREDAPTFKKLIEEYDGVKVKY